MSNKGRQKVWECRVAQWRTAGPLDVGLVDRPHRCGPAAAGRPDDYVGYKVLFADGRAELPCLAPIRRKFFDVHAASGSPVAEEVLRRIAALYVIEHEGAGLDPPQRLALRPQLAMPALAELHAWLLATQRAVAAGSGTAKAVEHALKRWPALKRYAGPGTLPIDNNPIENAIRPIAIGKKNWLFTGS